MSLETELRRALARRDPPSGFDDKVLSRIAAGDTVRIETTPRRWSRASWPIAASMLLALAATYYLQDHRRTDDARAQTEQAARDVALALQIASDTISTAQAKIEEITRYEPKNDY